MAERSADEPSAYPYAVGFPSRTFVGSRVSRLAGEELKTLGVRRACVITSRSVLSDSHFQDWMAHIGRDTPVFGSVKAHTPRGSVLEATRFFRRHRCDGLVSYGGGSAIDTAKAVALAQGEDIRVAEDFDRYMSEWQEGGRLSSFSIRGEVPPHVAIPTTLSGAAHTASAGVTSTEASRKLVHRHPALGPRVVLLDPLATMGTPVELWKGTGMKALEHSVEALYSRYLTPIDEPVRARAFRILTTDLIPSVDPDTPDILERRARLLAAAGMSLMNPPPFGISHAMGHQAGAAWSIAHAHTTAIFLPAALAFNAPVVESAVKTMAEEIGAQGSDPLRAVLDRLASMIMAFRLPRTLRDAGVRDQGGVDRVAEAVLRDSSMIGNPRTVTREDVERLLRSVF